ncbi:MAG TPA: type II toxin-antitoxin system Phd/YefM family antitoxin [Chloroflexi bacterium]|nr:type II toxin-antitoxin system Phd/YefM family antitoxin [Chloroflexota bacterium]
MPEVGVRELKAKTSEILRAIRERRARYVVTYRGRPVAALIPLDDAAAVEAPGGEREAWGRLEQLGEEIGRGWRSPQTSAELLSEMRR